MGKEEKPADEPSYHFTKIEDHEFTLYMLQFPVMHKDNVVTLPHKIIYKNETLRTLLEALPMETVQDLTIANQYELMHNYEKAEEYYKKIRTKITESNEEVGNAVLNSNTYKAFVSLNRIKLRHICNHLERHYKDYPKEKLSMSDPGITIFKTVTKLAET